MSNATTSQPLPVGVIGCGRMGQLHARVYTQMPSVKLIGVFDLNRAAAEQTAQQHGGRAFGSIEELAGAVSAATVAVPTQAHLAVARTLLSRGIACLIEKPLAKSVEEARWIADLAARSGATVQVGHIERFNPAVRAIERLGIRPGYMDVARVSPLTFRSIDVGVVLDMMIHDIDIVLKLAASPVRDVRASGVSVLGDVEDIANARVEFASGCVANLTASRLAMRTERRLRCFSRDAYVAIDYQKRHGIVVHRGPNLGTIRDTVARIRSGQISDLSQVNYKDLVKIEELPIEEVEPLRAQLDAFVHAVTTRTPPPVTVGDGLAAVELAQRIVDLVGPGMRL